MENNNVQSLEKSPSQESSSPHPLQKSGFDGSGDGSSLPPPSFDLQSEGPVQRTAAPGAPVMQRVAQDTEFGKFTDNDYKIDGDKCKMELQFDANDKVDATKIGLVQAARTEENGNVRPIDANEAARTVESGTGEGWAVDRLSDHNTPVYGSEDLSAGDGLDKTKQDNNTSGKKTEVKDGGNATYQLGHHYTDSGTPKHKEAKLYDGPGTFSAKNSKQTFETTALALEGSQKGTYYGSVEWGWERDGSGTLKKLDFKAVTKGIPSGNFLAAAKAWNGNKARGTQITNKDNTPVMDGSLTELFKLKKGAEVTQLSTASDGTEYFVSIEVVNDGTKANAQKGKTGYIRVSNLEDKQDGADTVDLPVPGVHVTKDKTPLFKDDKKKDKLMDLPKDTRMQVTRCMVSGNYQIKVIDGDHFGKTGYLDATLVKYE